MRQSLLTIEAECLKPTVSKHFGYLGIFLTVFLEYEFALIVVVLVLSTSPVFTSLDVLGKPNGLYVPDSKLSTNLSFILQRINSLINDFDGRYDVIAPWACLYRLSPSV